MAKSITIEYSKCYIYKPHFNFVKDGPLKKLLKLYHLYQLKRVFPIYYSTSTYFSKPPNMI